MFRKKDFPEYLALEPQSISYKLPHELIARVRRVADELGRIPQGVVAAALLSRALGIPLEHFGLGDMEQDLANAIDVANAGANAQRRARARRDVLARATSVSA